MTERVMFVDDEPNALAAFRRQLHNKFDIATAGNGDEGLKVLDDEGPFAVIVSDMQMPAMDGVQFLAKVKEQSPDTVRMILTGQADVQTAIDAVNHGNIFRFLTKPCPPGDLEVAVKAGLDQYKLIVAERELLEKTLAGSVSVLSETLSMVNPEAFSRGSRIRRYVRHVVNELQLGGVWQFELAAMLSQIGCVAVPPEVLNKIYARKTLTPEEQGMFNEHPKIGAKLLEHIPRLESIARMIEGQHTQFAEFPPKDEMSPEQKIAAAGAQVLKAALDFDQLILQSKEIDQAVALMRKRGGRYNPRVLDALKTVRFDRKHEKTLRELKVVELDHYRAPGTRVVADEDIRTTKGLLLVPKGQELTYPVITRLRNFSQSSDIIEPFRVEIAAMEKQATQE